MPYRRTAICMSLPYRSTSICNSLPYRSTAGRGREGGREMYEGSLSGHKGGNNPRRRSRGTPRPLPGIQSRLQWAVSAGVGCGRIFPLACPLPNKNYVFFPFWGKQGALWWCHQRGVSIPCHTRPSTQLPRPASSTSPSPSPPPLPNQASTSARCARKALTPPWASS
jgi:hypothetical protein